MTLQHIRHSTALSYLEIPVNIRSKEGYPTVYQQAEDIGGEFTRIRWGLPEGAVANFSPCLTIKDGHRLIAFRSQPQPFVFHPDRSYYYYNNTPTDIYVGELTTYDTILGARKVRSNPHRLSYEDSRLFKAPDDALYMQFVTSSYASKWNKSSHKLVNQPKICVGRLDEYGEVVDCVFPPAGQNLKPDKAEKNWCFFTDEGKLRLLPSTSVTSGLCFSIGNTCASTLSRNVVFCFITAVRTLLTKVLQRSQSSVQKHFSAVP